MAGVLKSHRPVTFNHKAGLHCSDVECEVIVTTMMDFYRHQALVIERECLAKSSS